MVMHSVDGGNGKHCRGGDSSVDGSVDGGGSAGGRYGSFPGRRGRGGARGSGRAGRKPRVTWMSGASEV